MVTVRSLGNGGCAGLKETGYCVCSAADTVRVRDAVSRLSAGRIHLMVSRLPYKCPPVMYEWALVIDDMLRRRGVREKYV